MLRMCKWWNGESRFRLEKGLDMDMIPIYPYLYPLILANINTNMDIKWILKLISIFVLNRYRHELDINIFICIQNGNGCWILFIFISFLSGYRY